MQISGETEIAVARQRVWDAVTDPNQVAACLPADPKIEVRDARHFRVTSEVGNAFMRTTVTIEIELTEVDEPQRVQATATGAVMASPATAKGWLTLTELSPESTHMVWSLDLTLGGMLVGFASMVEGPAEKGIERTIACLKARLEAEAVAES